MRNRIKLFMTKIDDYVLKSHIKTLYNKHILYRKAYHLKKELYFPPNITANSNITLGPAGELLCVGGDLSPERLLCAYRNGVVQLSFSKEPILWWTSKIRCIVPPDKVKIKKSMMQIINQNKYRITSDKAFTDVVSACSELREGYTWLTPKRVEAACKLNELGFAHSVEVWDGDNLIGGLFGVAIGSYWNGESMFSKVSNASKYAFIALTIRLYEMHCSLIDCGIWPTDHLNSLGSIIIQHDDFMNKLNESIKDSNMVSDWNSLFDNWNFKSALQLYLLDQKNK